MKIPPFRFPKLRFPGLPRFPVQTGPFPAREWRAHVALVASVLGAVAFTLFSVGMVFIIWKGGWTAGTENVRLEVLSKALLLSLAGALVVLISLGFAINRRMVKITKDGLEASGGGPIEPELAQDAIDYKNARKKIVKSPSKGDEGDEDTDTKN